jgi:DUF971 family protein
MPIPLDERKRPVDVQVHVSTGAGVDIAWTDGHRSHYDFAYLREECPCAQCNDERGKKIAAPHGPAAAPPGMGAALPMFKPKPRAVAAKTVGNYAVQIDFSDGHTTGIYSFAHLREICPCGECRAAFRAPVQ